MNVSSIPTRTSRVDRIDAIHFTLRVIKYVGLWPWQDENENWFKRNYRFLLHLPVTFTFITLMWLEAFVSQDLEEAVQVLYMSITESALVIKILNIWHHRHLARKFIEELEVNEMFALRSQEECHFWRQEHRLIKVIFYTYIVVSLGVLSTAFIGVACLTDYELAFTFFVPFEWRRPRSYWYAYGYNLVAMAVTCISNVTLDFLGCYFMFHIALLYRLLGKRLTDLRECKRHEAITELDKIFLMHHRIRRLSEVCQRLISPYILSQIVLSAFILCFSGFRIQKMAIKENPGQFIAMLQFVSVMILQIFLPCYYGNEMTVHSDKLTNMVYNTNWLNFDPKTRKTLILYMEFLKRPVKIKAGNFFEVGLPIFVKTINNSYSFLALLLNMSEE